MSKEVSFFSALLFAVHPLLTQAVSYVSGLGEPLGLFFLLLAILVYRKDNLFNSKFSQYLLFSILLIFSFLSKERSAIFLILFIIADLAFPKSYKNIKENFKKNYIFYLIGLIWTFVYFIIRIFILNFGQFVASAPQVYSSNLVVRAYSFLYSFFQYFHLTFFPNVLYSERPFIIIESFFKIEVLISFFIIITLLFFSIYKFKSKNFKPLFFGFFWFMFALLPSSGVFVMAYTMKEHWLYYSFVGFSLLFTFYFFKLIKNKKLAVSIFLIIILLLGVKTFTRNSDWSNPKTFFEKELEHNPYAENALANLAYEYYLEGDIDSALGLYLRGIEINDTRQLDMFYYNIGYMYSLKGNINKSIPFYKKSLEINPNYFYALEELAKYYYNLDDAENFEKYFLKLKVIENSIY